MKHLPCTLLLRILSVISAVLMPLSSFADTENVNAVEQDVQSTLTDMEESPSPGENSKTSATTIAQTNQAWAVTQTQIVTIPSWSDAQQQRVVYSPDMGDSSWNSDRSSFWLWPFLAVLFSGSACAVFSYLATTRRESKNSRIVAHALIHAFRKECEIGCELIDAIEKKEKRSCTTLPHSLWEVYRDHLSDAVLAEILHIAKRAGKRSLGFPPEEFMLHLGRYFSYIIPNINALGETNPDPTAFKKLKEASLGVYSMLEALEENLI